MAVYLGDTEIGAIVPIGTSKVHLNWVQLENGSYRLEITMED